MLGIYENANEARSDIHEINKELRKLKFSTRYQFDVRMLNDSSDYAKILKYAEYLRTSNDLFDDQISFNSSGHGNYEKDEIEKRENERIGDLGEEEKTWNTTGCYSVGYRPYYGGGL